jgi:hypothetical protein
MLVNKSYYGNCYAKIIFGIIIFFILGFFSYQRFYSKGFFMTKEEKYFYQKLKEFKESKEEKIALRVLTNFEWDEVCYIGPYSYIESVKLERFKLNSAMPNSDDEGKAAIVFFNDKNSTAYVFVIVRYHIGAIEFKENSGCLKVGKSLVKKLTNEKYLLTNQ